MPKAEAEQESKSPHLQDHFQNMEQQTLTASLGMWLFLSTEILLVGPIFIAYLVCRYRWPEAFEHGSSELKHWIGFTNTGLILTTSFLVTLALRAARLGKNRLVMLWLSLTILLGLCFLAGKGTEYFLEAHEGLVPGINFTTISPDEVDLPPQQQHPRPMQQRLFMIFYYLLTAIHAIHMSVALVLLAILIVLTWRGVFSPEYHTPIELVGMYWHFVDVVWIMIFSCLYLLHQG